MGWCDEIAVEDDFEGIVWTPIVAGDGVGWVGAVDEDLDAVETFAAVISVFEFGGYGGTVARQGKGGGWQVLIGFGVEEEVFEDGGSHGHSDYPVGVVSRCGWGFLAD